MPPPPKLDQRLEAAGGRDITIFMQSGPRRPDKPHEWAAFFQPVRSEIGETSIVDAGTMMIATLSAIRKAANLPHAPAVLVFDGLKCSKRTHMSREEARAYADKIVQVATATKGSQAQLVVHSVWLHAAEATRRAMLLQLTDTPLVFIGDDDFIIQRPLPFGMIHRLMSSTHAWPRINYVLFRWTEFKGSYFVPPPALCWSTDPCNTHPQSRRLLQTFSLVNQPFIARYSFLMDTMWATVPYERTAIEHHTNSFAMAEKNWGGWLYADNGNKSIITHLGGMPGLSANRMDPTPLEKVPPSVRGVLLRAAAGRAQLQQQKVNEEAQLRMNPPGEGKKCAPNVAPQPADHASASREQVHRLKAELAAKSAQVTKLHALEEAHDKARTGWLGMASILGLGVAIGWGGACLCRTCRCSALEPV
eukprot:426444-Prymnesium_polylepis.1